MSLLDRFKGYNLRYEFLPAAEEIVESPPSPFGRIVLWITIALLIVALLWAYFGKIDVIASASGKVIPDGSVKVVQPTTQSIITSIKVSEGQKVKKGQTLVELDATIAKAAVQSAEKSLAIAKLERDILKKIDSGEDPSDIIASSDAPQDVKDDLLQLAQSKQSSVEVRRQLLSLNISQAQSEVSSGQQSQQTIESNLQQAKQAKQQTEQQLSQATSDADKYRLETQLQSINAQIDNLESALAAQKQRVSQAQSGVSQANTNLQDYNAQSQSTNLSTVVDQDKKIADLEDTLLKAKKELEQQTLTAPVDGTVLSIASKTVGGVVTPAQPFITIVPSDAKLYVEANVSTNDIGFVKDGQKVAVKVDTYSFQRYGYLTGTVENISADAVQSDDKKGLVYKARIRIDTTKTNKDNSIQLIPGMTVTNEVVTGHRRIIEFFLDPLITHVDESLKVR